MKRLIHASEELGEDYIMTLMDYAEDKIKQRCEDRGRDEYVDDVKWGNNKFQINIFIDPQPPYPKQVNSFTWYYDSDDVFERSAEAQLDDALDDFFEYDFPLKQMIRKAMNYEKMDTYFNRC